MINLINPEFETYTLNGRGKDYATYIRKKFNDFLNDLLLVIPEGGRETAIVKTKLEEASFFAMKAMSKDQSNQDIIGDFQR